MRILGVGSDDLAGLAQAGVVEGVLRDVTLDYAQTREDFDRAAADGGYDLAIVNSSLPGADILDTVKAVRKSLPDTNIWLNLTFSPGRPYPKPTVSSRESLEYKDAGASNVYGVAFSDTRRFLVDLHALGGLGR